MNKIRKLFRKVAVIINPAIEATRIQSRDASLTQLAEKMKELKSQDSHNAVLSTNYQHAVLSTNYQRLLNLIQNIRTDHEGDPEISQPLSLSYDLLGDHEWAHKWFGTAIENYMASIKLSSPKDQNDKLEELIAKFASYFQSNDALESTACLQSVMQFGYARQYPDLLRGIAQKYLQSRRQPQADSPALYIKEDAKSLCAIVTAMNECGSDSIKWTAWQHMKSTASSLNNHISPQAALIYIGYFSDNFFMDSDAYKDIELLCEELIREMKLESGNAGELAAYCRQHHQLAKVAIQKLGDLFIESLNNADTPEEKEQVTLYFFDQVMDVIANNQMRCRLERDQTLTPLPQPGLIYTQIEEEPPKYDLATYPEILVEFAQKIFGDMVEKGYRPDAEWETLSFFASNFKALQFGKNTSRLDNNFICLFKKCTDPNDPRPEKNHHKIVAFLKDFFCNHFRQSHTNTWYECAEHALDVAAQLDINLDMDCRTNTGSVFFKKSLYEKIGIETLFRPLDQRAAKIHEKAEFLKDECEKLIDAKNKVEEEVALARQAVQNSLEKKGGLQSAFYPDDDRASTPKLSPAEVTRRLKAFRYD